jgi:hypothetical protein
MNYNELLSKVKELPDSLKWKTNEYIDDKFGKRSVFITKRIFSLVSFLPHSSSYHATSYLYDPKKDEIVH